VAREHVNGTRAAAITVFKSLLLTAPDHLRDSLRRLSTLRQTAACAAHTSHNTDERVLRQTVRSLAQRIGLLDKEIRTNERHLREPFTALTPALLAKPGVRAVGGFDDFHNIGMFDRLYLADFVFGRDTVAATLAEVTSPLGVVGLSRSQRRQPARGALGHRDDLTSMLQLGVIDPPRPPHGS
jgi:hypothetical protein